MGENKQMKRLVVWFALIALACAGAVSASTYVGYSGTFGVDNTKAWAWVPSQAVSPYTSSSGNLLRGQVHAHFINDGKDVFFGLGYSAPHSTPAGLASQYAALGYQFACITEHEYIATPPNNSSILVPRGCEEVSTGFDFGANKWDWNTQYCHVLALGMDQTGRGQDISPLQFPSAQVANGEKEIKYGRTNTPAARKQILSDIHARNGLAVIPHPNAINTTGLIKQALMPLPFSLVLPAYAGNIGGSNFSFDQLCDLSGSYDGISVFNAAIPNHLGLSDARGTWERLLDQGCRVWGYAEDDSTPGPAPTAGRTWVAAPGPAGGSFDWSYIKNRLQTGNFYSYWVKGGSWPAGKTPPQMNIAVTTGGGGLPNKISVTLSGTEAGPPNTAKWLYFVGKKHWDGIFRTRNYAAYIPHDSTYDYECGGQEDFIRVEAQLPYSFGTLYICSQPIMVSKTGNPYQTAALQAVSGPMPQSTSPDLHLRYLGFDEKPSSFPPAGYVGDAFDVTTDTGTVPSGATLQLSFDGEDTSALGGTQYLAIYRYDDGAGQWAKTGGTVDPATATIESPITALGKYCVSADLPVDTTAPEVFIDNPVLGGVVSSDTTVKATVNDDLGAWRVSFYLNDHLLAEDADSSDGWGADLKVSDYCTGDWTLKAEAEDLAGNVGTATIPIYIASSTPPPTVTISSPGAGNILTGTVTATGTCGDDVAVASVALKVDDTVVGYGEVDGSNWTCQIDTTYLADGNRTITATVEDYPGNSVSATVPVVIDNAAATSPLGNVKNASEGAPIRFTSAVVVADSSLVGDGFYAEAVNRTSGVKVLSGAGIHVGDSVSVVGAKTTIGHEAVVQAQDVWVVSTGNTFPKPIGTYGKLLLLAPDSIGKIVKLWGTIGAKDAATPPAWFMLNDHSGVPVKCKLASGVTFGPTWTLIAVTGVACTEDVSGAVQIDLLVTDSANIRPLVGT